MLLSVNVFPIATDMLPAAPAGVDPQSMSGPLVAFATFAAITLLSLYARGATRLWAPLIGILVGTSLAAAAGVVDWTPLLSAGWYGLPRTGWPGMDLSLDAQFFGLLVPFVIVTIVGAIETYGDAIAIQWVSHRTLVRRVRPDAPRRRPHPTGSLGGVMRESVRSAVSWVRAHAGRYDLYAAVFRDTDLHVHAQSAAETKDRASARVALVAALVSSFTARPVRADLAMTGEITRSRRVLPVAGVKEKVHGASRRGLPAWSCLGQRTGCM